MSLMVRHRSSMADAFPFLQLHLTEARSLGDHISVRRLPSYSYDMVALARQDAAIEDDTPWSIHDDRRAHGGCA
jgi:hypothetical protein